MTKRLFDIAASGTGLVLLLPVLAVIALLVKLTSPGPVFYVQERMGRGFRPFRFYKFRSMRTGADKEGALVTAGGDARITPVGRVLRKTKLDDLPQLYNVLIGDMSVVGPRPEVRKYAEMFRAEYEEVLAVRPGITDYASVAFRDEEGILAGYADPEEGYVRDILPRKIALYRKYIAERGMLTDLRVIVLTLVRIAIPEGPRAAR